MSISQHSTWVHGNAVIVEDLQPNLASVAHRGWGTDIAMHSGVSMWLHIPLPTPEAIDNHLTRVTKIYLLFTTGLGVRITRLHLYDGGYLTNQLWRGKGGNGEYFYLDGDHPWVDEQSTFELAPPFPIAPPVPVDVHAGLGISFLVEHPSIPQPSPLPPFDSISTLTVYAAGALYETGHPDPPVKVEIGGRPDQLVQYPRVRRNP